MEMHLNFLRECKLKIDNVDHYVDIKCVIARGLDVFYNCGNAILKIYFKIA